MNSWRSVSLTRGRIDSSKSAMSIDSTGCDDGGGAVLETESAVAMVRVMVVPREVEEGLGR